MPNHNELYRETLGKIARKPEEGYETVFDVVREVVGKDKDGVEEFGTRLVVERRKLLPEAPVAMPRAESCPRSHEFFAVGGFVEYLKKFGSKNTVLFADVVQRRVQAVIDERAGSGKEIVVLEPQVHPRWEPCRAMQGRTVPIEQLADFVRMNRKAIVEPDGRALVFLLSQIECATEVVMHRGKGAGAVNGLMIKTTIKGGGGTTTDPVALPDSIKVKTPVWVDQAELVMEIDLVLTAKRDGTEVYAQLASADIVDAEIVAFDVIVQRLRDELGTEERFTVTHGSYGDDEWARLPAPRA